MTSRRIAVIGLLVGASVVLATGGAVWVRGSGADPVLGSATLTATGSQAAPSALALAVVTAAGLVAALTARGVLRRVCSVLTVAAAGFAAYAVVRVIADPQSALDAQASAMLGRTGSVAATAEVTIWAWVALAAAGVMALGAVRLAGPGATGGADGAGAARFDPAPEPSASDWDALTHGQDPTER